MPMSVSMCVCVWVCMGVCIYPNKYNEEDATQDQFLIEVNWFEFCDRIYIYTCIYFHLEKTQTGHIRIINLFPSCYVFLIKSKITKKYS